MLSNQNNQIWIVVNQNNKQALKDQMNQRYGYKLSVGDILRFGKVRFKVKRIGRDLDTESKESNYK